MQVLADQPCCNCLLVPQAMLPQTFKLCWQCSLQADDGYLYPLERAFFYVQKPPTLLVHDEIESVEFLRQGGVGIGTGKTFDLSIRMRQDQVGRLTSVPASWVMSAVPAAVQIGLLCVQSCRLRQLLAGQAFGGSQRHTGPALLTFVTWEPTTPTAWSAAAGLCTTLLHLGVPAVLLIVQLG